MIFTALIAKFLSAGAVAQAATGATVAVVAFTGVGAVGALPDPVQDTFATVVADLTSLEPPTSEEITDGTTEVVIPAETLAEDGETADELLAVPEAVDEAEATATFVKEWATTGPGGPEGSESFSAWVHEGNKDARVKEWLRENGMNFGNVVSKWASGKDWSEAEFAVFGEVVDDEDGAPIAPVTDETVTDAEETAETEVATTKDRGSRGNGKADGDAKGKGNGKN